MLGGMPMLAQDISPVNSVSYEWKSVPIVGGGFVDGIVFHPEAPGVRYCRTDMGGAYRWDAVSNQWTPLLDWISLTISISLLNSKPISYPYTRKSTLYFLDISM